MKKIGAYFIIGLLMMSCQKEAALDPSIKAGPLAQGGVTRGTSAGVFSAMVDGNLFEAEAIRGEVDAIGFSIEAFKSDGEMSLSTFGITTGNYQSGPNPFNEIGYSPDTTSFNDYRTFYAGSGSDGLITVISYNKSNNTISGTFSGHVESISGKSIHITNGSFGNILVLPRNDGYMEADIGSSSFDASSCSFTQDFIRSQFLEVITAMSDDSSYTLTIAFPNNIVEGTFDLDTSSVFCVIEDKAGNIYDSNQGEVKITKGDRLLNEFEGNFDFIAIDTSTLTILNVKSGDFFAVE